MLSKLSARLWKLVNWIIEKSVLHDYAETQVLAMGKLLSNQQRVINSANLEDYEFKIFSQFGDDGIIQHLIKNVRVENCTFIEFWVEDYSESNTRFLMMNNNWSWFVMDGSTDSIKKIQSRKWYWRHELTCKPIFITKENINNLVSDSGFSNLWILHIDLDGNDYWILEAMDFSKLNPSILILEYNAVFGADKAISVPYDAEFVRTKKHYSNLYFWASLKALNLLSEKKWYRLVGCNSAGNNAYFVRSDLLNERIHAVPLNRGYRESKFRESRDIDGNMSYVRGSQRLDLIANMPVINIETGETELISTF